MCGRTGVGGRYRRRGFGETDLRECVGEGYSETVVYRPIRFGWREKGGRAHTCTWDGKSHRSHSHGVLGRVVE